MDCGIETCAVFFDLKKVFDSVPHRKLISNLKSLQLNPALTKWICSYLSGRYQRRVVEGAISQVVSGIQQGSVLGPLLFLLYIDNLSHLPLSRGTKMVLYADDRVTLQGYISTRHKITLQSEVDQILTGRKETVWHSMHLNVSRW